MAQLNPLLNTPWLWLFRFLNPRPFTLQTTSQSIHFQIFCTVSTQENHTLICLLFLTAQLPTFLSAEYFKLCHTTFAITVTAMIAEC